MKKKETFILRTIGDSHVMMPVGSTALKFNGLITANETAAFIWEHIEEVESAQELAELVCREFDVSADRAAAECETLINQLKKAGWIE